MNCELCGQGREYYLAHAYHWSNQHEKYVPLCRDHYKQVLDFIESLKPQFHTKRDGGSYYVSSIGTGPCQTVDADIANALYEYLRKERNEWRCPECGAFGLVASLAVRGFKCESCGATFGRGYEQG